MPVSRDNQRSGVLLAGRARWVRSGVVSLVATSAALAMHVAAGGTPPPVSSLAVFLAAATGVCWLASGVRWSAARLLAVLAAAQAGFHLSFMVLARPAMSAMSGMVMTPASGAGMAAVHSGTCSMSWSMLGAHAVAAMVTALLLARGEALLWSLLVALGSVGVPSCTGPRCASSPRRSIPGARPQPPSRWEWVAGGVSRRGPPRLALV